MPNGWSAEFNCPNCEVVPTARRNIKSHWLRLRQARRLRVLFFEILPNLSLKARNCCAIFSESSQALAASSLLFLNLRKRLRFQALALRRNHKNVCVEITNIPCFQRAHVSNIRLNFNQPFDKVEVCDDAGDRGSAASTPQFYRRVRTAAGRRT